MALDVLNFAELRQRARARLPRGIFEYIDRGAEDEVAHRRNRRVFEETRILPRALTGGSPRSLAVELFGRSYPSPVIVAPTAFAGLVWHRGEIALARAAAEAGIVFCAATEAITAVEEIAAASPGELWFQLYLWEQEELWRALLEKAWAGGVRTLMVTVDTQVYPKREFNTRNGFGVPFRFGLRNTLDVALHPRWALGVLGRYLAGGGLPNFANYPPAYRQALLNSRQVPKMRHEPDLSWEHIRKVRDAWRGTLILKGILRPEDALRAAELGAEGIVVSNHGGRILDSAPAPLEVLPAIAAAVGGRLTLLADSGVQRGSDVFKLLAAGAKGVLVGRAFLYGTALGGTAGALKALEILDSELERVMALSGCKSIATIDRDWLA